VPAPSRRRRTGEQPAPASRDEPGAEAGADAAAGTEEEAAAAAPDVRLTADQQDALRRRLREKFH